MNRLSSRDYVSFAGLNAVFRLKVNEQLERLNRLNAQVCERTDGQTYAINQINFNIGVVCEMIMRLNLVLIPFKSFHLAL